MQYQSPARPRRRIRRALAALALAGIFIGSTGLGCDGDAAAVFRETATGPIGEGVKGIMNGILDGMIAAIEEAGDGGATDE